MRCACNLLVYCSHYLCILRDACETEMASCCLFQPSQSSTGDLGSASHFYTHPWGGRNFKIVSWVSGGYDMNLGFKWSAITHRSILLTFLHQDYGTHLGPEEMIYEHLDCILGRGNMAQAVSIIRSSQTYVEFPLTSQPSQSHPLKFI